MVALVGLDVGPEPVVAVDAGPLLSVPPDQHRLQVLSGEGAAKLAHVLCAGVLAGIAVLEDLRPELDFPGPKELGVSLGFGLASGPLGTEGVEGLAFLTALVVRSFIAAWRWATQAFSTAPKP